MLLKKLPILFFFVLFTGNMHAQTPCTTLGQTPPTAFPVCGTAVFFQDSVPICATANLYVPGCSIPGDTATTYQNKNPYWYKFTCFEAGTLSFVIRPNLPFEDYDWQLYDVTGHNPNDVFTDTSLVVTGNWSGTYDSTGANATGLNFIACESVPSANQLAFAASPTLIQGHNYLLMVSHFSDGVQGYTLSFGGGTAVITDTLPPHMVNANNASCDGSQILVKLNKRMKCSSLQTDGSDFVISPAVSGISIISALGYGCSNSFDMDSVLLTFSAPLPFGNYDIVAKHGSDGNTLLDLCDNGVPVDERLPFSILSPLPVPMNSLSINQCVADSLILDFPGFIKCSSVAADGSDFRIEGTYPVTVNNATPVNCINGLTRRIVVRFGTTMIQPGSFQIILQTGTDGNTLLSECDTPSVAGSALPLEIKPKPVANFGFPSSVCLPNAVIDFSNLSSISDGSENSFQYLWNFDDLGSGSNNISTIKTPTHTYVNTGPYSVNLRVTSNAGCVNDTTIIVNGIHPQPITNFGFSKADVCIGDAINFTDSTNAMDGVTTAWFWNLGNGATADIPNFTYTYPVENSYNVSLYSINSHGCKSNLLTKPVTIHSYPVVNAGPDRTVLEGGSLTIQATATGTGLQYLWTPSQYLSSPTLLNPRCVEPKFDISYTLTVTAAGSCSSSDVMFIDVLKIPLIPNTFTPNNDGVNDFWEIKYLDEYRFNHTQVFTRAGQLVFESRGLYKPWNGTYKGKALPVDTYYYIIEPGSGRENFTGFVTIIK